MSACISPSYSKSTFSASSSRIALRMRSMRSISRLPKLEKERNATRGSWPMVRALPTICLAMVASCSGDRRLVDRGVGQEHRAVAGHHDRVADRHLAGLLVDHVRDVAVAFGEAARDAGHHAGGVAHRHHAGAEHVAALVDHALHVAAQVAVALQALVDQVGVGRVARRQPRIVDLHAGRAVMPRPFMVSRTSSSRPIRIGVP